MFKAVTRSIKETIEVATTGETKHHVKDPDTGAQWKVRTLSRSLFEEMNTNNFNHDVSTISIENHEIEIPHIKKIKQ
jgi:hypothetical protein